MTPTQDHDMDAAKGLVNGLILGAVIWILAIGFVMVFWKGCR